MYASKTTRGFYDAAIHGDNMPADAVEITAEEHIALLEGQSNGKIIDFDEAGRPFLADPKPLNYEQLAAVARGWRDAELLRVDIELNKVQDGMGTGSVSAWRAYRCELRNWPSIPTFPESSARPIAPDAE